MHLNDSVVNSLAAVSTAVGSLAAVVVAVLALRTYRDLSPAAAKRRRQQEHMDEMTALIIMFLDLQKTFAVLRREHIHPDKYIYNGIKECASLLRKSLSKAHRLGLTSVIVGQGHAHQWPLYNAFLSGVLEIAMLDPNDADPEDFTKEHFLMGIIRLGDGCRNYMEDESRASEYVAKPMKTDLANAMDQIPESTLKRAWGYLAETTST